MDLLNPLPAFRYIIALSDSGSFPPSSIGGAAKSLLGAAASAAGGFTDCSGLEVSIEIFPYMEGGVNDYVHKLPTRASHSDIVLKRGLLVASHLSAWVKQVASGDYQRKDGLITLLSTNGTPAQVWWFRRGLPTKWTGPTLSASQNSVAMESLTIAHEGLFNAADEAAAAIATKITSVF